MDEQLNQLIDIPNLLFSILWIIGFSAILAALSIQHYQAQISDQTLRERLQLPPFQMVLWGGLSLAAVGFAGNGQALWETVVWTTFAVLCGYYFVQSFLDNRQTLNKK